MSQKHDYKKYWSNEQGRYIFPAGHPLQIENEEKQRKLEERRIQKAKRKSDTTNKSHPKQLKSDEMDADIDSDDLEDDLEETEIDNNDETEMDSSQPSTSTANIPTSNRYSPLLLQQSTPQQEINKTVSTNKFTTNNNKTKKSSIPTPIFMHGKFHNLEQTRTWLNIFNKILTKGYTVKHTPENVIVQCFDNEEKTKLSDTLTNMKINHHTHRNKDEKTHAFVMRGLLHDPPIEEIKNELIELGVKVITIYKMHNTRTPLFLVITDKNTNIKHLDKNIKFINHTKIKWERQHMKREIIQCKNCQRWGHGASYCKAQANCLKCGEQHHTYNCEKPRDTPATCYNCKGDHPSNSTNCPIYLKKIEQIKIFKSTKTTKNTVNLNNQKDFPNLPKTNKTPINNPAPAVNSTPIYNLPSYTQHSPPPAHQSSNPNNNINDLNALLNEIKSINNIINIKNLTRALKEFKGALLQCNSAQEKGMAALAFNWEAYGI